MLRLGQKTSNKLLKGIFVALRSSAVALMSSVTVRMRSLFSGGSCDINDLSALIKEREGGRIPVKLGIANVDREGGFRKD